VAGYKIRRKKMGKTILGYVSWTLAVNGITYWFVVGGDFVSSGEGFSIPITILGVVACLYSSLRIMTVILEEWDG
jgi:hypothetical protein